MLVDASLEVSERKLPQLNAITPFLTIHPT